MTKIDITSTAVEKSIDIAKGLIEKLTGSAFEEIGLMWSDNIKFNRFKLQIKILNKAQKIIEESGINTKQISLKTLVPLLEYSSLEEDETLQDKWANLIVNYADSNEKLTSTIFPYILNQLSTNEITVLESVCNKNYFIRVDYDFSGIEISNLIRLGLIEIYDDGIFYFHDINAIPKDKGGIRYSITELGIELISICTNNKTNDEKI